MSKGHTPGPWVIERPEDFGDKPGLDRTIQVRAGKGTYEFDDKGSVVASLTCYTLATSDEEAFKRHAEIYSAEQIEANARLIAAAPFMLETLRSMSHTCDCYPGRRDGSHFGHCTALKANIAIDKAEGRA